MALDMKAAGRNIIGLATGEPDFATPPHIVEAATRAMHDGHTRYTQVDGIPELKAAIVRKFERENGVTVSPEQISVGTGGKQVLFNALMATVNNGDEVGNIFFAADDGTDLVSNTAAIKSQVDGAPGANDTPGNLTFWTTPDGSNTATQKVTISNAGLMTVTKQYYLVADLSNDIGSYNATGAGPIIFNRIAEEYKDASLASCFNTSTGLFTTPVTGLYFLEAACYSTNGTFGQSWWVVAGARKSFTDEVMTGGGAFTHNLAMLRLTAGETVGFLAYSSSGSNINVKANANHTYMKIALMH